MHIVYIDDSNEKPVFCFSAIAVPAENWKTIFGAIKNWRINLKKTDGIKIYRELHATEFLAGRGELGDQVVTKYRRAQIFKSGLSLLAAQPGVRLFNACNTNQLQIFEYLLNRISRTMKEMGSLAILICDEGREADYTRLTRMMSAFNYIPSQYGAWGGGEKAKNIPIDHIIEDPIFKESDKSYFVQMADFCAFSLLRWQKPTDRMRKYGLDKAFDITAKIRVYEANKKDKNGIIR